MFLPRGTSRTTESATSSATVCGCQRKIGAHEKQLDTTSRQLDTTSNELHYAQLKIQVLEERLRLARMTRYGKASETLSDLQLELLELEPGVSSEEVQAESERGPRQSASSPGRWFPIWSSSTRWLESMQTAFRSIGRA